MKNTPSTLLLAVLCTIALSACESDKAAETSTVSAKPVAVKSTPVKPAADTKVSIQKLSYKNIDNTRLQQLLDEGVTLIDIRQADEWKKTGLVPGSEALTFFRGNGGINPEFLPKLVKLADPTAPVALISDNGNRTLAASRTLADQLGYKKVYNVKDGIKQWIAEGRTVASLQ